MLSVGKLTAGAEDYYLKTVAEGAEEYYLGSGEAPGYWLGSGADKLGLAGEVDPDYLRALLAARVPVTGEPMGLRQKAGARVAGFDLTFSSPKSVSLLYGLASPDTSEAVRAAHDAGVAAGVAYLDLHGAFARRGAGGARRIGTAGLVGAAFRHRTSRSGDPQLHTHVLVANAVEAGDGRWSALDARVTYYHARTAGFVYEAVVRHELATRLGLSFTSVVNGIAEIGGVGAGAIRAFSTRRLAIQERLAEWGSDSPRAAQLATLATRPAKQVGKVGGDANDHGTLTDAWRARARQIGLEPAHLEALTGPHRLLHLDGGTVGEIADHLLSPEGLTAQVAAFERRDVVREVAASCPDGASLTVIEHIANEVMASPEMVALGTTGPGGEERHTTRELLAIEKALRDTALASTSTGRAQASEERVAGIIRQRPTLSAEQAGMVRRAVTSGDGVEMVIGVAGAGKTYALDAAREVWEKEGHRVYGAALSARAAGGLAEGAGLDATTIAFFEMSLDDGSIRLGRGDVVVVDEAAMVGTRTLARIVDAADRAAAKVVLVGDDRQLPNPHRFESTCGSWRLRYHEFACKRMSSTVSPR